MEPEVIEATCDLGDDACWLVAQAMLRSGAMMVRKAWQTTRYVQGDPAHAYDYGGESIEWTPAQVDIDARDWMALTMASQA